MASLIDRTGQRFGRLAVLRQDGLTPSNRARWLCRCDCGESKTVVGQDLQSGRVKSCGCLRRELMTTHGQHQHPLYTTWNTMKQRCTNPNNTSWPDYGARGITVCERWLSFENFLADMGDRPAGMTLDRIDPDLGYRPDNCRWATREQQNCPAGKRPRARLRNLQFHRDPGWAWLLA